MRTWGRKKPIGIIALSLLSFWVIAESIYSIQFHSTTFMNENEIRFIRRLDEVPVRELASSACETPKTFIFPASEENKMVIDGKWRIYRYINADDVVKSELIDVDLKLIGLSQIEIDGDDEQIFQISLIRDFDNADPSLASDQKPKTIALWKKAEGKNCFEIVEAVKVVGEKVEIPKVESPLIKVISEKPSKRGQDGHENEEEIAGKEFVLVEAFNSSKSEKSIRGSELSGSFSAQSGSIGNFDVTVKFSEKESVQLSFSESDELEGTSFTYDYQGEKRSGIFNNRGDGEVFILLVNGDLAGTRLMFKSEERMEKDLEKEQLRIDERYNSEEGENFKELYGATTSPEVSQNNSGNERLKAAQKTAESIEAANEEESEERLPAYESNGESEEEIASDDESSEEDTRFKVSEETEEERESTIDEQGYEF